MDTRPAEDQRFARTPRDWPDALRLVAQHNLRLTDAALAQRCIEAGAQLQASKIKRLEGLLRSLTERIAKLEARDRANQG